MRSALAFAVLLPVLAALDLAFWLADPERRLPVDRLVRMLSRRKRVLKNGEPCPSLQPTSATLPRAEPTYASPGRRLDAASANGRSDRPALILSNPILHGRRVLG